MLIGREKEKKILSESFQAEESRCIAVYGRRRVGKTYLIRESLHAHFTFQHTGLPGGTLVDELFEFCLSLRQYGLQDFPRPRNWLEAFECLKELIRKSTEKRKLSFWTNCPGWTPTPAILSWRLMASGTAGPQRVQIFCSFSAVHPCPG